MIGSDQRRLPVFGDERRRRAIELTHEAAFFWLCLHVAAGVPFAVVFGSTLFDVVLALSFVATLACNLVLGELD